MIDKKKRFLIIGLGLLGGSYAMGLKKRGHIVSAIDINEASINYALEKGIIDEGATTADPNLISQADVIISGLYPKTIVGWISENQQYFKKNALITDVTGVKCSIIYKIQELLREDCEFIGSHPMAGKEVSGVQFADSSIFLPANLIITPTSKNTQAAIDFLYEFGIELRFNNICILTPEKHDEMIGYLSQLTHVIAVSLMNANDNSHLKEYTGDSFRDLTRIAKINENLWTELFLMNKDVLVNEITAFVDEINDFKQKLMAEDVDGMKQKFIQSTKRRKYFDK
ncbi:prephenate dehydrogenase [Dielma fastidiosa]|uniref:prephenate dehydrogenase n=1 Tax=Dielma fastidiosa TaxID=1034346 RepID=UPI000EF08E76|nr:prephenate dehydrogenase [Dielma fastidiosa]HAH93625.1 prephenate dehydrogenase/arogenate dehydrogenase family protein [Dielma fastidiosa]